ncbi:MAG: hypothetical protein OES47_11950 [Acidobacteriota bacterium]|nr:hypothetical protein [Acidobacteriota bacterium]
MRRICTVGIAVLALAGSLTAAPQAESGSSTSSKYPAGEPVVITGTVTSSDGKALAGVEVALTGYRRSFDVWRVRRTKKGEYTILAVSGADGRFEISWRWDDFYNHFELRAGIGTEVPEEPAEELGRSEAGLPESADTSKFLVLAEADLSKRIRHGSPVVSSLIIKDTELLESWQGFLGTLESREQRRVYQELGKPDKVQNVGFSTHREVAWWYFERGKVYRFRDGEIDSIEDFEPVLPSSS